MKPRASKEALRGELRQSPSPIAVTAVKASTFVGPGPLNAHPSG